VPIGRVVPEPVKASWAPDVGLPLPATGEPTGVAMVVVVVVVVVPTGATTCPAAVTADALAADIDLVRGSGDDGDGGRGATPQPDESGGACAKSALRAEHVERGLGHPRRHRPGLRPARVRERLRDGRGGRREDRNRHRDGRCDRHGSCQCGR
jgi:hypothetical protein